MANLYEQLFDLTEKIKNLEDENKKLKKEIHEYSSQEKIIYFLENIYKEIQKLNEKTFISNNTINNTDNTNSKIKNVFKKENIFIPPINTNNMGLTSNENESKIIDEDFSSNLDELEKINL